MKHAQIALIKGDGIGIEVSNAALAVVGAAARVTGGFELETREIEAGAGYYARHGIDIEVNGEDAAGEADAIFLGAIGLPDIRRADGTEISPHLRLRERYQLFAGVRPVRAYPNAPSKLVDDRAQRIDLVILRESTEGLFYSAAVHGRGSESNDREANDTLRITRATTEKLHRFGFELARQRKTRGRPGLLTCVDKANVFVSMAFFRRIFDEIGPQYPDVEVGYNYVDAQALDLIRRPWEFDVLVTENMFGDILSDLAGGLVGGMGMAACAEIGDRIGLFQPAHGSAPGIRDRDLANPLAAILSGGMMLEYLAAKLDCAEMREAGELIDRAVSRGFEQKRLRPCEFGGDMGTRGMTSAVIEMLRQS